MSGERSGMLAARDVTAEVAESEYEEDDDDEVREGKELMKALTDIAMGDESDVILHDTPNDAWGVFIFVIVRDIGDITEGEITCAHIFRVCFSISAMCVNLTLQFAVLWWVFGICFDTAGAFDKKGCEAFPAETKYNLCQAGLSQPLFLGGILFLWTLAMLVEFRENLNLHRHLSALSDLPAGVSRGDQVLENTENGDTTYLMVALCPITRSILYLLVIIPKYIIIAFLTFIGWRWLSSSESFTDLILNSLALQFIVTVDELIFSSMFPESMVERIQRLHLAVPKKKYDNEKEKKTAKDRDTIRWYTEAAFLIFFATFLLGLYVFHFQNVLPGYEYDLGYLCQEKTTHFSCKFMATDCFPKGPTAPVIVNAAGTGEV